MEHAVGDGGGTQTRACQSSIRVHRELKSINGAQWTDDKQQLCCDCMRALHMQGGRSWLLIRPHLPNFPLPPDSSPHLTSLHLLSPLAGSSRPPEWRVPAPDGRERKTTEGREWRGGEGGRGGDEWISQEICASIATGYAFTSATASTQDRTVQQ